MSRQYQESEHSLVRYESAHFESVLKVRCVLARKLLDLAEVR
jgi:hypothetical protein